MVAKAHRKVRRILERRGWVDEAEKWVARDKDVPLELELASASAAGRIAQGARPSLKIESLRPLARPNACRTRICPTGLAFGECWHGEALPPGAKNLARARRNIRPPGLVD